MQIKKFYASDLPAAIRNVRRTLGRDAVIVSTRHLSTEEAGVFINGTRARVEVTAAREAPEPKAPETRVASVESDAPRAPRPAAPRRTVQPEMRDVLQARPQAPTADEASRDGRGNALSNDYRSKLRAIREGGLSGRLPEMADRAAQAAQTGDGEMLKTIVAEIRSLKQRLDSIDRTANPSAHPNPYLRAQAAAPAPKPKPAAPAAETPKSGTAPGTGARGLLGEAWSPIPPGRVVPACDVQRRLREQGVDEALGQRILERMHFVVGRDSGGEQTERGTFGQFVKVVRDFLPGSDGMGTRVVFSGRSGSGGPRRVALVGPTGVGKTTTIAKIASHCALQEGMKVGLITLDTYRVAAAEQLKTYARLLGVPCAVAGEPSRLARTFQEMEDMDVVLVDTPGHSPRDDKAMGRLAETLATDKGLEVHLLVPASVRLGEMREIMASFQKMRYERLVFSKLDEATAWGDLLSAWIMGGYDVSYFTTGQRVPEDLQVASADTLCQCLMAPRPAGRV